LRLLARSSHIQKTAKLTNNLFFKTVDQVPHLDQVTPLMMMMPFIVLAETKK